MNFRKTIVKHFSFRKTIVKHFTTNILKKGVILQIIRKKKSLSNGERLFNVLLFSVFAFVGVAGFEPTTSSSRTTRATKLRYTPKNEKELRIQERN